ncbi:MAG: hypothetical protein KIT80_24165, partial [Chitinophagaceae bacterium]|nr:hypothetical protein [Chitinophagaceae bacterium]
INGVRVELYGSGQTPGVSAPVAVTTTATSGTKAGVYRFAGLVPGNYVVYLPTPPAGAGRSSGPTDTADNREDGDDNGIQTVAGGPVISPVIALSAGEEDGTVGFGFVPDAAAGSWTTVWQIGVDDNPAVSPYKPYAEFSSENGRNDAPPGVVTRLPGDPQYNAAANPDRDDDHYMAGNYAAGFNGLVSALSVPNAEPDVAWERSLTWADRTNRVHFQLTEAQAASGTPLRLSVEFAGGGWTLNGVGQSGFYQHEVVVRWKNRQGGSVLLASNWITKETNLVLNFTAGSAGALSGANTLEVARLGPGVTGGSHWILFDYLRLESQTVALASLGGQVWLDGNGDGLTGAGEAG